MAFKKPQFNLFVNLWPAYAGHVIPPDPALNFNTVPAQIRLLKTAFLLSAVELGRTTIMLCVPKGTVIGNADDNAGLADLVEAPARSGRIYRVEAVEDVAKGFDNEYRVAALARVFEDI